MTAARYPETVEAPALVARPGGQFAVEPLLAPGPGRDNIVVRAALLRSVQDGRLPVELLITDRLSPANAAGFLAGLPERQRALDIADHRMGVIA
jgi:hypothetical protein